MYSAEESCGQKEEKHCGYEYHTADTEATFAHGGRGSPNSCPVLLPLSVTNNFFPAVLPHLKLVQALDPAQEVINRGTLSYGWGAQGVGARCLAQEDH